MKEIKYEMEANKVSFAYVAGCTLLSKTVMLKYLMLRVDYMKKTKKFKTDETREVERFELSKASKKMKLRSKSKN
jgi:peptidyl-prolyl cis-trans isomerase D